ncbi:MAG: TonB-dependent receptor [Mediterranea sp.]|jgi:TonB-linked SusC/RagA family outer membrane protein|nr:TonB-dependent receptor [Mediterranea sp.]
MSKEMKNMRAMLFLLFVAAGINLSAQTITVTGNVKDNTGEPVIGASVVQKGTTGNGSITDLDGNYRLSVPSNATIIISYIGMKTQEIAVNGKSRIDVTLTDDAYALDEVVAIGYATMRRGDLTGAISSVSAKDIAAVPVASVSQALTGKMAGVQVTTTDGSPDAEIKIRVRGGGSITQSSEPLYIVDGFPVNSINDIAANDIASIDVLKDASSTAIYGARGANGVVIVTTKGGQSGKVSVNYNTYVGFKKIAHTLDVLDPYDYALWTYEHSLLKDADYYKRYFGNWEDMDMYEGMEGNDWQDIMFGRVAQSTNHSLSISGGSDKTRYMFSYNRINDEAIAKGSDFKRDNLSLKLQNNPNDRIQLDFQMRWSQRKVNGPLTNDGGQEKGSTTEGRLRNAVIYPSIPLNAPELTDPTETDPEFGLYSPTISLRDNDRTYKQATLNMAGSASWEFIDGFRLKTEMGVNEVTERTDRFYGVSTYYARINVPGNENKGKPAIIFTDRDRRTIRNTNTLSVNLKKWLPDGHSLDAILGQEYLITATHSMETVVAGFDPSFDLDMARRLTTEGNSGEYDATINNNFSPDDKMLSFFGRLNYNYKGNYLLSATLRADGSSKFAAGNRWGYFPSVSAAWRISGENFMQAAESWLYDLKLRASYGTAGNNNIPSGQMAQTFSPSGTTWVGGYSSYWAPSKQMANPNLKWETTITRNIGVDWALFNGRLAGTVEVYKNNTLDLLLNFPTAGTGYDNQYRNMGETENKGLEISANWVIADKKNWGVTIGGNIGFNKNRVISLGDMDEIKGATNWASTEIGTDFLVVEGQPIGVMYGYRALGRYEVDDFNWMQNNDGTWEYTLKDDVVNSSAVIGTIRPGSLKLAAKDGGLTVLDNDEGKEIIGNANPKHTGGGFLSARVYGFDLTANFNWSYGNDIYNANKLEYTETSRNNNRNMIAIMKWGERWTNLDLNTGELITDPAQLTAANATTTMWSPYTRKHQLTDWAVEDGSFLRLNTLTLGYTFPKNLLRKVKIENLRIYVTGYNIALWTNYSGFDPEVDTRRNLPYTPGVDYSAYPRSRQLVYGLNLTF